MLFDTLRFRCWSVTLLSIAACPLTCVAVDVIHSGAPAAMESPVQVTEDILQLRQTFGSAWRDVGGEATPETTAAEEAAIRTALLDEVRSNPLPERICPPRAFCRRADLRESAHQLDLVAHTLERQELYDEADQLRAIAQRLRVQAREKPPVALHEAGQVWKPVEPEAAD